MSIDNVDAYDGEVSLVCDDCGKGLDFPSFQKAVAFKKKQREKPDGWRSSKEGGVWKDHCSSCSKAYKDKLRGV